MVSDYQMLRKGITSMPDYLRLEDEFQAQKAQRALEMQKAQRELESGNATNDPANVREWQFYSQLPEEEQQKYLQMKRAEKTFNMGGQYAAYDPITGSATPIAGSQISPSPAQQFDINKDIREQQDQFNRGLQIKKSALDALNRLVGDPENPREFPGNIKGVERVSGPIGSRIPVLFDEGAYDAAADIEFLKNLNTTENLGLLKGVLSDTDMKILASVGSGELAGSDEKVVAALKRMRTALSGKVSAAQPYVGAQGSPPLMSGLDPMEASRNAIMQRNAENPELINPNQTLPEVPGQPSPPKKGEVIDGYMFLGGDPSKQSSWKKAR